MYASLRLIFCSRHSLYIHCLRQTPQVPPSLAQCLQYWQFLQALQGVLPVNVAKKTSAERLTVKANRPRGSNNHLKRRIESFENCP